MPTSPRSPNGNGARRPDTPPTDFLPTFSSDEPPYPQLSYSNAGLSSIPSSPVLPIAPPPIALAALAAASSSSAKAPDPLWELKQKRLGAKVERAVEAAKTRERGGAFEPPEEGYTFPSPVLGGSSPPSRQTSGSEQWGEIFAPVAASTVNGTNGTSSPRSPVARKAGGTSRYSGEQAAQRQPDRTVASREASSDVQDGQEQDDGEGNLTSTEPPFSPTSTGISPSTSTSTMNAPPPIPIIPPKSVLTQPEDPSTRSSPIQFQQPLSLPPTPPAAGSPADRILRHLNSILAQIPPPSTDQNISSGNSRASTSTSSPDLPQNGSLFSTPCTPSTLSAPPRRLILDSPALQVVNAHTVKDRHLFLFTDILVIAKPLLAEIPVPHPGTRMNGEAITSSIENDFVVKSVVELKQLGIVTEPGWEEELNIGGASPRSEMSGTTSSSAGGRRNGRRDEKKRHPMLVSFVDRFANDPKKAIKTLIERGGLQNDAPTIASLLFKNPDLNRNAVGAYLAAPDRRHVLRAYLDRFRFAGVRIDEALRMFMMTLRYPHTLATAEHVLGVFSLQWTDVNTATGMDPTLTFGLVLAIMRLSDALHGVGGDTLFSLPNRSIRSSDFIAAFREHDPRVTVSDELLATIFSSVRRERVQEASDNSMFTMTPDIEATFEPEKPALRLKYRVASERMTISLPAPDPNFTIKFHGVDLVFDPPVLEFAYTATRSFTVTGTALGLRAMVLIKLGSNAPRYQGLPLTKTFSIERAFLFNTFQLSFSAEDRGGKRAPLASAAPMSTYPGGDDSATAEKAKTVNYMFSMGVKANWARFVYGLKEGVAHAQLLAKRDAAILAEAEPAEQKKRKQQAAAIGVSIKVLRDSLIPPEDALPVLQATSGTTTPQRRLGTPTARPVRSASVSKIYPAGLGMPENDIPSDRVRGPARRGTVVEVEEPNGAAVVDVAGKKTGKEIVSKTEQNSLLPLLLGFLGAGAEVAPHPLSRDGTAFRPRPA